MPADTPSILIIDDGSLPALAAIVTLPPGAAVALWHAPVGSEDDGAAAAVDAHAALLEDARTLWHVPWPRVRDDDLNEAALLLQAVAIATEIAAPRVIWPVQTGPDPAAVAAAVDRAATVTDLVEIGRQGEAAGRRRIVIDLPLVDLDDEQIVDLVDDAGAPMRAFWPCLGHDEQPCGTCPGCERWAAAFTTAGLPWPWAAQPVAP